MRIAPSRSSGDQNAGDRWLDPTPGRRLRIMFLMLHPGYVRNYESTLRLLLERGHNIQLAFAVPKKQIVDSLAERLSDEFPNLTFKAVAKPKRNGWRNLTYTADGLADFSRYLHPRYRAARKLRARVVEKLRTKGKEGGLPLLGFRWIYTATLGWISNAWLSDALVRFWLRIGELIPSRPEIDKFIEAYRPDLFLSTPLVSVGSFEPQYIRTAHRRGVRTGLCVASWDNLSNKGVIKGRPQGIFVWNEIQRNEAVELHGVAREQVIVTGAQRFDGWFEQRPTWRRESFCRKAGLDPTKPYLLYVCSSPFIAPDEVSYVRRIVKALRTSRFEELRDVGVLIRPHPQNAEQWQVADLGEYANISIWPRAGAQPVTESSRAVFFDSIYHSSTVLGVNTSAQVEAGIIGRSVHTLLSPEFEETQEGTLHFHYLLHENGGLLHVAATMDELLRNLHGSVAGKLEDRSQLRAFVGSFVRPLGPDVAGTPVLAGGIERLGQMPAPVPRKLRLADVIAWLPLRLGALLGTPITMSVREARIRTLRRLRSRVASMQTRRSATSRTEEQRPKKDSLLLHRQLRSIAKTQGTLLAGPWLGDVRHEVLYWIPLLRRFSERYSVDASRLIAVSATGARSWYDGVVGDFVNLADVIDLSEITELQAAAEQDRIAGSTKDLRNAVIVAVRNVTGAGAVLDPALLRPAIRGYWHGRVSIAEMLKQIDIRGLRPPRPSGLRERLPEKYVAVQTGFERWFPATPANRATTEAVIARIAERWPVVVLDRGRDDGERGGIDLPSTNLLTLVDEVAPGSGRFVDAQSECLAGASGFVGAYSGFAHVAQGYGVGAIALYSEPEALPIADLDVAYRLFAGRPGWILPVDARRVASSSIQDLVPVG